ncbi:Com family DNA-binding transcriptional regulator [Delftia acidovorans]|uniref:Com family DNA-binding transcriptional regulator n=1 Tax=Delftia acidovorans TaxID=80866 RepID=UPI000F82E820|nr:Com family DNA-binding transcriptional regulator [Delftia acidovorans]
MQPLKEIRCGQCGRKLAMAIFEQIQIKCPRCGTMNHMQAESLTHERPGASIPMTANDTPSHRMPPDRQRNHLSRGLPAGAGPAGPAG